MKTLGALLEKLTAARVLAEVPVIRIRPITDHSVPTLNDPELASTYPMVRTLFTAEASNTPFLQAVTFPLETMSHIPSPVGGAVDSLTRRIRFSLLNRPYRGFASYFDYLTRDALLDRADLALQVCTVPPRELGTDPLHLSRLDFQGASEGQETDYFTGFIERVVSVGDTIECEGKSTLPFVDWKLVPDDGSDRRDVGLRLPLPLGEQAPIRCVNLQIGAATTTAETIAIADDSIAIGEESGTIPDSASGMLGAEAISWTGRSANTLTGVTRGELGTAIANHVVGTALLEVSPIVLGVASVPISSVRSLFVQSFTTGALIKVPDLIYSVDYDDETNAPGSSGDPIVTATFDATQLRVLVNTVVADAAITVQAEYTTATIPTESTDIDATVTADNATVAVSTGATGTWTSVTTTPTWTRSAGGTQEVLRTLFSNRLTGTAQAKIKSARFGFDINVTTLTQTTLTVGLQVTGAEVALVGVPDGTIVASVEITETGTINNIFGSQFTGSEDGVVGDLYDIFIDVTKGEVTGGNPTVVFTINATRIEVTYFDDSVEPVVYAGRFDTTEGAEFSDSSPTWNCIWTVPHTGGSKSAECLRDDTEPRLGWRIDILTAPIDPADDVRNFSSIVDDGSDKLRFAWSGDAGNSAVSVDVEFTAIGDWSNFADKPSPVTVTANADTVGATNVDIGLTNIVNNARWADTIGLGFEIRCSGGTDGDVLDFIHVDSLGEVDVPDSGFELTDRVTDAEISASAGGIGLEFFALIDGPFAPDGTYDVDSGLLMNHPSDLIRYWLQEVGGIPAADVDDTTFDAAVTNLVGYEWGFDARNLGINWEAILLRMGYEARANIVKPSDVKWKLLTANTSFSFGAAAATIDSTDKLGEIHKDNKETESRLTVFFDHDPRFDGSDNRSFKQVQTTDPTDAAVILVEAEFGRNDAEPYFLFCHNGANAAGVTDWRKYMQQELGRGARIFAGRTDHWQAYPLEIGDVVNLVTTSGTTKARVLEVRRDQRQGFVLRYVEVL